MRLGQRAPGLVGTLERHSSVFPLSFSLLRAFVLAYRSIVSSLSLSDRVPYTFFPLFFLVFNSSCLFFFTFHIFVNRTVGVSSGKKLTLFFLVSCPVSLPISSPFKLKKITYDRSTFVNPPISIQTRYRSLSYKRNGCPIVSKRFSLSRSLPLPVPSSPLHPAATLEVIFGSVHTSTIPSDLRRRRYLVGRPTGESARLNGAKDKE